MDEIGENLVEMSESFFHLVHEGVTNGELLHK